MILRMYELAASDLEPLAGWPAGAGALAAPIAASFPADQVAVELAVAPTDARGTTLDPSARQATIRRLIPWLVRRVLATRIELHAVNESQAETPPLSLVARLDGLMQRNGLIEALQHLGDAHESPAFSIDGAQRLYPGDPLPAASFSMVVSEPTLAGLCADPTLRLDGSVRLRVFAVPQDLAPALVGCRGLEDPRWPALLEEVRFYLTPSAGLRSVFVIGTGGAQQLRETLTEDSEARFA